MSVSAREHQCRKRHAGSFRPTLLSLIDVIGPNCGGQHDLLEIALGAGGEQGLGAVLREVTEAEGGAAIYPAGLHELIHLLTLI